MHILWEKGEIHSIMKCAIKRRVFLAFFLVSFNLPVWNAHAYVDDMWNLIIPEGETVSFSGYHKYLTKVEIAGTLNIDPPEVPLVLQAPIIIIQPTGIINGNEKGYLEGPGLGHWSDIPGFCGGSSGGGGYGGRGGNCCCIDSDYHYTPGGCGLTYGTSDGFDIDMGSGGLDDSSSYDCRGGGCIILIGYNSVTISGALYANGGEGMRGWAPTGGER